MKTILVPTDFSTNAYSALYYAAQLFADVQCKFIIVHSFENQVSKLTSRIDIGKSESIVDQLYTECDLKCDQVKHKLVLDTMNAKHTHKTVVTSMSLGRAINKLIEKENVDFVAMGSKGSTAARDILVGSTTLKMMRKIKNTPLLIVPEDFDYKPLDKIAFATGFKRAYSMKELEPLVYISAISNTAIKVIHVHKKERLTEAQRANFHQLFEHLKKRNPENNWLPGESDDYAAITSYLDKEEVGLLSMIYYKHNTFIQLFREATIKNIAKFTHIPFLILPALD